MFEAKLTCVLYGIDYLVGLFRFSGYSSYKMDRLLQSRQIERNFDVLPTTPGRGNEGEDDELTREGRRYSTESRSGWLIIERSEWKLSVNVYYSVSGASVVSVNCVKQCGCAIGCSRLFMLYELVLRWTHYIMSSFVGTGKKGWLTLVKCIAIYSDWNIAESHVLRKVCRKLCSSCWVWLVFIVECCVFKRSKMALPPA